MSVFIFQALAAFVQKCLEEADKLGYSSIAFPALGTGARSFPADVVASTMFHVVEMHSKKKPTTRIQSVLFVIWVKDSETLKVRLFALESLPIKCHSCRRRPHNN